MSGVIVDREGAIARLVLNRPEVANAIDRDLAQELRDAVRGLGPDVRVVVLAARGSVFCAGGDLRDVTAGPDPAERIHALATDLHEALLALDALDAVIIAAVGGAAAGAGLGLVLHADLVVASDRARFLTAYEAISVTPDAGVTELLPRTIGLHRALRMSVLGERIDASTAHAWGLVAEVVAPDALDARVSELAATLAAGETAHLARTRRLYRAPAGSHEQRLDREAAEIRDSVARPDALARIERFRA